MFFDTVMGLRYWYEERMAVLTMAMVDGPDPPECLRIASTRLFDAGRCQTFLTGARIMALWLLRNRVSATSNGQFGLWPALAWLLTCCHAPVLVPIALLRRRLRPCPESGPGALPGC
jgi:hypothetical protein